MTKIATGLLLLLATTSAHTLRAQEVQANSIPALPTFLYLRCNATSWEVDSKSRLRPYKDPKIYTVVFQVEKEWMVSDGDQCSLTATPMREQWGESQVYFGLDEGFLSATEAPRSLAFGGEGQMMFQVRYPSLGKYRAILDLKNAPSLRIEAMD